MKISIILTWSKIVALIILALAFILDLKTNSSTAFMFSLPFAVVLITGKQLIDSKKPKDEQV